MLVLALDRLLPAPPPVVFEAFTEPDRLAAWWGPEGFSVPTIEFNPRVGESYRLEMQPPEGSPFHLTGRFLVVEPPLRLAFTFVWEPPDSEDVETIADLSFRNLGGSTEVTVTQGPFRTAGRRALHRGGWTESFDKLERLVAPA